MSLPLATVSTTAAAHTPIAPVATTAIDVDALVTGAVDQTRGLSSYAEMSMLIKRPSWQRKSTLKAWTRGREDALIRFVAPTRDAVNALLKQGERMWTYTPKLNKSIRLPGGMMSQSWAGSDFSYDDMSRSDKWLRQYRLEHVATEQHDGMAVYVIDAIPKEDAAVVWGKEQLRIRADLVLLELAYFDQDMQPVRRMRSLEVGELGGRMMATRMRMQELDRPDQYTELEYLDMDFDIDVPERTFTLFSLQSGRNR
ncbi:MAG: outer membrane lipoprotein-sorting protein [Proteobacteria bacterium]|nr:outer membrane lipoprotein-sorting protein [Pseudomonadota bacterium]